MSSNCYLQQECSGYPSSLAPSRILWIPVPAFSIKAMRCSKSAIRGLRRKLLFPRSSGDMHLACSFEQQTGHIGLIEKIEIYFTSFSRKEVL